ncbi:MAG: hypothetical protein ACYTFG_15585 [Planctomycetota bacterium]|jgi:hypothetical protein
MTDVWEVLSGSHPVSPTNTNVEWAPHVESFFQHRTWPRDYLTSLDMAAARGRYRWVIYEGCLLVCKWFALGGRRIYLVAPPMSASGDVQREKEVIEWLVASGVGARLSEEDLALYGGIEGTVPCSGSPEFVYRAGDYTAENMTGRSWRHWRQARNAAERTGWTYHRLSFAEVPRKVYEEAEGVLSCWAEARDKSALQARKLLSTLNEAESPFFDLGIEGWLGVVRDPEGVARSWSVVHRLVEGRYVLVARHWAPADYPGGSASRHLFLEDARAFLDDGGPGALFTRGSGVGIKSLERSKRSAKPCHELRLLRPPSRRVTKEEWEASRSFG